MKYGPVPITFRGSHPFTKQHFVTVQVDEQRKLADITVDDRDGNQVGMVDNAKELRPGVYEGDLKNYEEEMAIVVVVHAGTILGANFPKIPAQVSGVWGADD